MTMPDRERKFRNLVVEPSAEFEKMLSELRKSSPETLKEVERVIKTPDSETKLTYEIQVDPATGKQKVIEKFTTTKRECPICGGYFSRLFSCLDCGAQVCANELRQYSWTEYHELGSPLVYSHPVPDKTLSPMTESKTICKSCAASRGIK
jgi:hypothetical protein